MAINFPDSPSVNDTHTVGDKTWTWDGTVWSVVTGGIPTSISELSITNDLTVDTDTLHVDSTNNRVGIGTASPTTALDISQVNPTLTINDTDGVAGGSIASLIQFEASNTVAGEVGFGTGAGNMISWAKDGNYYAGTQSADNVFLRTNNFDRVTIDSSGAVGIGTTSPSEALDVDGNVMIAANQSYYINSGTSGVGRLRLHWASSTGHAYVDYKDDLNFRANGSGGAVTFKADGKVGIGTTSPAGKLHVEFDSGSDGVVLTNTANTVGKQGMRVAFDNDRLTVQRTSDSGVFEANYVSIDQDTGNVGIGTTSPNVPLTVEHNNTYGMSLASTGTYSFLTLSDATSTGYNYVGLGALGDELRISAGGSQRMTIDSSGNVGIGTTSPSYKLDVNGALAIGNTSQIFTNWGSGSDIDGLLPGSTFGGVMYTNTSGHFAIGIRNNDTADSFSVVSGGNNTNGWTADNTFDLLVANFRADGNGSIAGTWTTSASDERLKTVTGTITEPLTKISALEGFYFTWNDVASELGLPDEDVVQVGVSAQSVLGVMPEAVRTAPISQGKASETEYYTVMYERLVPLLIEGVKAQQTQIDALTAQNAALTARIEALEAN